MLKELKKPLMNMRVTTKVIFTNLKREPTFQEEDSQILITQDFSKIKTRMKNQNNQKKNPI